MKKIIYLTFMSAIILTACTEDDILNEQGIKLQELPGYVAFFVNGVEVTIDPIEVNEGDESTGDDIKVEIPTGTLSNVTVNYTFSGSAVFGTDFNVTGATSAGGSVVIEKQTTPNVDGEPDNADIVVNLLTDNIGDGEKVLNITLTSASNNEGEIVVGRAGTDLLKVATIIISDDDYVSFASESESVQEDDGTTKLEIEAHPGVNRTNAITVDYSLGGTAVFGVDYTIAGATSTGGTVTIPAPATPPTDGDPITFELDVDILTDLTVDGEKTIEVTLTSADDGAPLSVGVGGNDTGKTSIITITDVDM